MSTNKFVYKQIDYACLLSIFLDKKTDTVLIENGNLPLAVRLAANFKLTQVIELCGVDGVIKALNSMPTLAMTGQKLIICLNDDIDNEAFEILNHWMDCFVKVDSDNSFHVKSPHLKSKL